MKLRKISKSHDIFISDEPNCASNQKIILINNKVYYRFMERLYIPDHVYKLPVDFVIELNNIRYEYSKDLIDVEYNELAYRRTINSVAGKLNSPLRILDFGCGEGGALPWICSEFPETNVYGFDIRKTKGSTGYFKEDIGNVHNQLPYPDDYFSVVFSFFVFHFFMSDFQLSEIRRTLRSKGFFAFNLINSTDFFILDRIYNAGFSVIEDLKIETNKNSGRGFIYCVTMGE